MTPLFIHNTLSGKKAKFHPLKSFGKTVTMYSCGPTVYDSAHIGNFRTFVMSDIVKRVLEYKGYGVHHAMNVTDVDDKTIRRSREEGVTLEALTEKYEKIFWADMASLNIKKPGDILSARGHIGEMIELINVLLKKEIAYVAKDGVYLSVGKVKNYGELAGIDLKKMQQGRPDDGATNNTQHERIANDEYDKENPRDFALWKFTVSENAVSENSDNSNTGADEIAWDAPFGHGRPGWHIECSAMAMKALGKTIDIHTGGVDLIFPHHTNEIAQSESATKKPFVNYWIHGGFMNVNDEKMAKSKGNFLKLSDLTEEHISPIAFRYWLLTSHYRSQVNFSFEAVRAAQTALFKLCHEVIGWAEAEMADPVGTSINKKNNNVKKYLETFDLQISDDFNMPQAVATLWKIVKDPALSHAEKRFLALDFDKVFGLRLAELSAAASSSNEVSENSDGSIDSITIPPEILALAEAREAARLAKDFQKSDALRLEIESRGYHIKDTSKGYKIEE